MKFKFILLIYALAFMGINGCVGSKKAQMMKQNSQKENAPFNLEVNLSFLFPLMNEVYAADDVAYCDTYCSAKDCLYLYTVNDGMTQVICHMDLKGESNNVFQIHNIDALKGQKLFVETSEFAPFHLTEVDDIDSIPFATSFAINETDIEVNEKSVTGKRSQKVLLDAFSTQVTMLKPTEIEEFVDPSRFLKIMNETIYETNKFGEDESDFYDFYTINKEIFENEDQILEIQNLIFTKNDETFNNAKALLRSSMKGYDKKCNATALKKTAGTNSKLRTRCL